LAQLLRFFKEEAQLFPYELRKLAAIDPEDKSTWEIDVRMWAGGRYKDFLGLRLNSPLPPRNQFKIVDGAFRYQQVGNVPVDNHIVYVENSTGERIGLPLRKRISQGEKTVQLYFVLDSRSPRRLTASPGGTVNLAGVGGVTATYTLSAGAPYTLTDDLGRTFPLSTLNVAEVRARIQPARPAPTNPNTPVPPGPVPPN
jgi:hypothetical protein